MIISPCISICKTDPSTGYCYGCGRNNEEKKKWKLDDTTDDWKKEFGKKIILLTNGRKVILKLLKKDCQVGNQKVLKSPILIKLKMVSLYLKKI